MASQRRGGRHHHPNEKGKPHPKEGEEGATTPKEEEWKAAPSTREREKAALPNGGRECNITQKGRWKEHHPKKGGRKKKGGTTQEDPPQKHRPQGEMMRGKRHHPKGGGRHHQCTQPLKNMKNDLEFAHEFCRILKMVIFSFLSPLQTGHFSLLLHVET